MIRFDKWTYFVTIICSDTLTLGVKEISKALLEIAGKYKQKQLYLDQGLQVLKIWCWKQIVEALNQLDLPLVMGAVLLIALTFVIISIIVDLLYAWIDPRVRN